MLGNNGIELIYRGDSSGTSFLFYNNASYVSIQNANGFVQLAASVKNASGQVVQFRSTVIADLVTASSAYAIQSTNGCKAYSGRGVGTN